MKRLIGILALLVALPLAAQTTTITTPEVGVTATRIVVSNFTVTRNGGTIGFEFQATDTTVKRTWSYGIDSSEIVSFLTALGTARASETGTVARRTNFRIVGWMADGNRFRGMDNLPLAVTVAP